MAISADDFIKTLSNLECDVAAQIAAGISGGPDSMALLCLLADWAGQHSKTIHALTVNHGLRPESGAEASMVEALCGRWPHVNHVVLQWEHDGDNPDSAVQERARSARYDLMEDYCQQHDIKQLFLGHHQDDQAETFLMRLSAGSGLDGLACMDMVQKRGGMILLRPLLSRGKQDLIETCRAYGCDYVDDPSNDSVDYLRGRLRHSWGVLQEEGLTPKRLAQTAKRMRRAREALEYYAERAWQDCVRYEADRIEIKLNDFLALPQDIGLRIFERALNMIGRQGQYGGARYHKIESHVAHVYAGRRTTFTLGGVLVGFEKGCIAMKPE